MKYFKIQTGYADDEYISINSNELPKAMVAFTEGTGRVIFNEGAVRGQDIIRIVPDWHRHFGYNRGYKMQPQDHANSKLASEYSNTIEKAKDIARFVIERNRRDLLSKSPTEVYKLLPEQAKQIAGDELST